ncbi:hypothetical protein CGCF415_v013864 [Colletotrichum fructicola]|nr:hypothetical protein CGCFRS4_v013895 [Colletotrichum fructicola]KAF4890004.1 hypothetical protein CGCF415_v013864 [Colletotrichum fructicola]KAF4926216.1 hypothetical protein CGCF245_v013713 [Colletotrichum fructicola]
MTANRPLLTGPSVLHARPPTFHRVTPLAPKVIDKVHLHEQPIPERGIDEKSWPMMKGSRKTRLDQHQDSTA